MLNATEHVKFAHYMIHLESLAAILEWSKQSSGKHNTEFLLKLTLFPTFCNETASQYDPFLSAAANFRNGILASCPFVCPHGTTRLTPGVFSWNSVAKIQISFKQTELRVSRVIHEDANTLMISNFNSSRNEKFQTKVVEENKTHASCPLHCFRTTHRLRDNHEKHGADTISPSELQVNKTKKK